MIDNHITLTLLPSVNHTLQKYFDNKDAGHSFNIVLNQTCRRTHDVDEDVGVDVVIDVDVDLLKSLFR